MKFALTLLLLLLPGHAIAEPIKTPPRDAGFVISLSVPYLEQQPGIGVYDVDLFDTEPATIDTLHAAAGYVICYFSAGTVENWRPDAAQYPPKVIGLHHPDWPGENWLDIRERDALAPILEARLDLAVQKNCDAVDPDNVDGFSNGTGFDFSAGDQVTFNRWLADAAHARGLAIGLKNAAELVGELAGVYDFSIIESCAAQNACDDYRAFVKQGKAVYQIEYHGETLDWDKVCRDAKERGFIAILAALDLDGKDERCP